MPTDPTRSAPPPPAGDEPLRQIVRRVVGRVAAERGAVASSPPAAAGVFARAAGAPAGERPGQAAPAPPAGRGRALVDAAALAATPAGARFAVPAGALVTELAREEASRRGIRLVRPGAGPAAGPEGRALAVAVGCDHGGFAIKALVLGALAELGLRAVDLGAHGDAPVDYPDFARAVAEAVAEGRVSFGVCLDAAGIGSAMAANKVPGVRAANCWDERSAASAREHNYANVLALGARLAAEPGGEGRVLAIVRAFFSTAEGAARHARRVAKIAAIERRWSRIPGAELPSEEAGR